MHAPRAFHGTTGPGRSFFGPGDQYTFLVTSEESGGSMFSLDCLVGVGGGPPPHRHLLEDELFFLYEGAISFAADGETRTVSAGQSPPPRCRVGALTRTALPSLALDIRHVRLI